MLFFSRCLWCSRLKIGVGLGGNRKPITKAALAEMLRTPANWQRAGERESYHRCPLSRSGWVAQRLVLLCHTVTFHRPADLMELSSTLPTQNRWQGVSKWDWLFHGATLWPYFDVCATRSALLHEQGCLIFCFLWFLFGSEDENGVVWTEVASSFLRKPKLVHVLNLFSPRYMCELCADRWHGKDGTSGGRGLYSQTAVSRFLRASNFH